MRFLDKHTLNYVITTKKGQTSLFLSPSHQGIIRTQVDRAGAKQPESHEFRHQQTQVNRENTKPTTDTNNTTTIAKLFAFN